MSDFAYSERDFTRIRRLIHERAGIALAEAKRDMAYSRLTRLLRAGGHRRMADYLDGLERKGSDDDWQDFVNALTTNLTSFFHAADVVTSRGRTVYAPVRGAMGNAA